MELRLSPEDVWQATLGELQLSLQRPVYDNWLRGSNFVAYEDGCFIIATKTAFAQAWLDNRMKGMIKRRLERLSGRSVDVRFIVRPDAMPQLTSDQTESPLLQAEAETNGRYRSVTTAPTSTLRSDMTFMSLVEGDGNRFACAAAQAVAHEPGVRYNPLFLYGGVGLGKTHLLHAVGNATAEQGYSVRYVTSETFTNDLIEAIRTKSNSSFRQTYREVDILLIDDIQFIEGKDSTQNEFFHTFNSLYATNKQIVIASDRAPRLLTRLEDRLRSRFDGGLTADLQAPDLEHRIAILRAKNLESGTVIANEVLAYIAETYSSNVRELEGALNRVTAYARHHAGLLDLATTQNIIGPHHIPLDDSPDAIISATADEFRVTVSEIKGPRRTQRIVVPRQAAMYLMRELAQLSFPQIGEQLGGRDHTTVMHGTNKMATTIEKNADMRNRLEKIQARLRI